MAYSLCRFFYPLTQSKLVLFVQSSLSVGNTQGSIFLSSFSSGFITKVKNLLVEAPKASKPLKSCEISVHINDYGENSITISQTAYDLKQVKTIDD